MNKSEAVLENIFKDQESLSNYAFSLSLFMSEISQAAIRDGITDLFFLAREGQYLKKLFEEYQRISGRTSVHLHYLYVSRKSCLSATLRSIEEEDFEALACYHVLSVNIFLRALSFDEEDIAYIVSQIYEDGNREIKDFFASDVWKRLKENARFQEKYDTIRRHNRYNLLRYLDCTGFTNARRPALVDVGWRGTMQDRLFSLGLHQELIGYYIGLYRGAIVLPGCKKYGLLFDGSVARNAFYYSHNYFEYLCVADHGSTEGYTDQGIPLLREDEDCTLYRNYFQTIQNKVLGKFCHICEAMRYMEPMTTYNRLFESYHARMLLSFTNEEKSILSIAVRTHPDGLAAVIPPKTVRTYLSRVKRYAVLISKAYYKRKKP